MPHEYVMNSLNLSMDLISTTSVAPLVKQYALPVDNTISLPVVVTLVAIIVGAVYWWRRKGICQSPRSPSQDSDHMRARRLQALSREGLSVSSSDPIEQEHRSGATTPESKRPNALSPSGVCDGTLIENAPKDAMQEWRRKQREEKARQLGQNKDERFDTLLDKWKSYVADGSAIDDLWDLVEDMALTHAGAGVVKTILSRAEAVIQRKTTFRIPDRRFVKEVGQLADSKPEVFLQFVDRLASDVMENVDLAAELISAFNAAPDENTGDSFERVSMSRQTLERRLETQTAWVEVRTPVILLCAFVAAGARVVNDAFRGTEGFASRVALALNYDIFRLVGPPSKRFSSLVHSWDVPAVMVVSRERAGFVLNSAFDPGTLLVSVIHTFGQLGHDFLRVAAQERQYFRVRCFENAAKALPTMAGAETSVVRCAQDLEVNARVVASEQAHICEVLLDYPEEFECPLGMCLMQDPVRLPSAHIVDRAFMSGHFRVSNSNPFTREPLSESDLVGEPVLKARIDSWIK